MDFEVRMTASVEDPDVDIMGAFENAITDRFAGTAIKVRGITVMMKPAMTVNSTLRSLIQTEDWDYLRLMKENGQEPGHSMVMPSGLMLAGGEVAVLLNEMK